MSTNIIMTKRPTCNFSDSQYRKLLSEDSEKAYGYLRRYYFKCDTDPSNLYYFTDNAFSTVSIRDTCIRLTGHTPVKAKGKINASQKDKQKLQDILNAQIEILRKQFKKKSDSGLEKLAKESEAYLTQCEKMTRCSEESDEVQISVYEEFTQDQYYFKLGFKQTDNYIYHENGSWYVNQFRGIQSANDMKYKDFDKSTRQEVEIILKHIKEILCNNDDKLYDYVVDWVSSMLFRKLTTALYLQSIQGTGKSLIFSVFLPAVVGYHARVKDNLECLKAFNGDLETCSYLVFEELKRMTNFEFNEVETKLKNLITNPKRTHSQKYKDQREVDNLINMVLLTNRNALPITSDNRRFVVLDISADKKGDLDYFEKLANCIDSEDTQKCFYSWCKARYEKRNLKNWKEQSNIPKCETMQQKLIESIPDLFKYIKDEYVLQKRDLNTRLKLFSEAYAIHHEEKKLRGKPPSHVALPRMLKECGINVEIGYANKRVLNTTYSELYKIFDSKKWLSDLDIESIQDNEEESGVCMESVNEMVAMYNKMTNAEKKKFSEIIFPM